MEKITKENFLFYLLILLLPVQLGRHFWPKESFVWGIKVDYLSPTVYLTDIIIFLMIGTWIIEKKLRNLEIKKLRIGKILPYILGLSFLILNCFLAKNQLVAFYKLVKIIEMGGLVWYMREAGGMREVGDMGELGEKKIINFLAFSVFYSSIIAIFQFLKQGSIGGVFWFLGERTFTAQTPGIAKINFAGRLFLRPYGTFPHPNVLGGFLALTLPMIFLAFQGEALERRRAKNFWRIFLIVSFFSGLIALFLTFSRTAILAFLVIIALMLLKSPKKKLLKIIFLFFLTSVFLLLTSKIMSPESFTYRQKLNVAALKMIADNPIFGVGLNNFIVKLPDYGPPGMTVRFLQPVHNIYLLVAAETGFVGLGLSLWLVLNLIRKCTMYNLQFIKRKKTVAPQLYIINFTLLIILFLGFFDHYFLTLQQGMILLGLVWGMWGK